jgi:eukaryotic-like serine/threonine-protein kinase
MPVAHALATIERSTSLALPLIAGALERNAARYGALELIENHDSHDAAPAPSDMDECPSDADLLDFCHGRLPAQRSVGLQHHLDLCATCMDLATLAVTDWAPSEPAEWLEVASNFHPGERVDGHYQIVRFLAGGGMGEVYEAIDTRTSERIALKAVLAASSDNRHMLRSFRHEARLARKVRHPNVCHVHDSTSAADVVARPLVPYFTMEYIDGETLNERLWQRALSLQESLEIARQLLLGMQAIHRAGVLHLDIKSSNVMLRRGCQHAVILDFGLARRASEGTRPERMRPLTGSLAYMPPEQILGQTPSEQNDIFAFGVVLFQMLTRELPFPATQPSTASNIARRLTAVAPAPSEIVTGVPGWLDEIVMGCLAEPGRRFRGVEGVREAMGAGGSCAAASRFEPAHSPAFEMF